MTPTKRCSACKQVLPLTNFWMKNKERGKYHSHCRACDAERQRKRKATDPEYRARRYASTAAWRKQNPDKLRQYNEANREKFAAAQAAYRARRVETPEQRERRLERCRAYYLAHRDEIRARVRETQRGNRKPPFVAARLPQWARGAVAPKKLPAGTHRLNVSLHEPARPGRPRTEHDHEAMR